VIPNPIDDPIEPIPPRHMTLIALQGIVRRTSAAFMLGRGLVVAPRYEGQTYGC